MTMMDKDTGKLALADGPKLHYSVEGQADGDWIVLSNSLATDLRLWDYEVSYLAERFKVLRYDVRGHGQSDASPAPYTFDQLSDDLVALMDHLGIAQADILGISLGGMTALAMGISYPDRVKRILCCDARADAPDPYKAIWDGNIAKLHAADITALCAPTLERWFTAPYLADAANTAKLDVVRDMFIGTAEDGYEGVARCLQSLDLLKDLGGLPHEALFIGGAADMAAPVAVMQGMAKATPNGRFVEIADAAHLSNLEQPEQFKAAILGFLS